MKKTNQIYSIIDKIITLFYAIILLSTSIYWIYYKFIDRQIISTWHSELREFIFWKAIREIVVLTILLGILFSLILVLKNKNFRLLFISVVVLIFQILLFSQLNIYKGP